MLYDPVRYQTPIPFSRRHGSVTWVRLKEDDQRNTVAASAQEKEAKDDSSDSRRSSSDEEEEEEKSLCWTRRIVSGLAFPLCRNPTRPSSRVGKICCGGVPHVGC